MKIKINKIASTEIQIVRCLSDDILEFKLDAKTTFGTGAMILARMKNYKYILN